MGKRQIRALSVLAALFLLLSSAAPAYAAASGFIFSAPSTEKLFDIDALSDIGTGGLADAVRQAMLERQPEVSFRFHQDIRFLTQEDADEWVDEAETWHAANANDIPLRAMAHTGRPTEGDYLLYQIGNYGVGIQLDGDEYGADYRLYFTFDYFTTAEEEREVTRRLTELMPTLVKAGQTDAEKVRAIYSWICSNVTYDDAHRGDESYHRQYTAYGALVDGTAVCQGISALFYRMALEAGLDARVVSGISYGNADRTESGSHAWNIVKVDGKYYNIDCTWDAGTSSRKWLLKGKGEFDKSHVRENNNRADYTSPAFDAAYPMAASDYKWPAEWKNPFTDVKKGDACYDAVRYVYENRLFLGVSDTTFAPEGSMTRAMFVTVLGRLARVKVGGGTSAFRDVAAGQWYTDYVDWAAENGIVTGYGDGRFGPDDPVTREQAALILARYAATRGMKTAAASPVPKDAGVSAWAADAAAWAVGAGVWPGEGGLRPAETASRGFVARMLYGFSKIPN